MTESTSDRLDGGRLELAIDQVSRELTGVETTSGFRAQVMTRIEEPASGGQAAARVWRMVPVAASILIVAAAWLWVRAPDPQAPIAEPASSGRGDVALPPLSAALESPDASPVAEPPEPATRLARRSADVEGVVVDGLAEDVPTQSVDLPAGLEPLVVEPLDPPALAGIDPIDLDTIQLADNGIAPLAIERLIVEPME